MVAEGFYHSRQLCSGGILLRQVCGQIRFAFLHNLRLASTITNRSRQNVFPCSSEQVYLCVWALAFMDNGGTHLWLGHFCRHIK